MDVKFDFNEAIEQLAQAFNTTVDKLYPVLVQQAYVYGISWVVGLVLAWGAIITLFIVNKKLGMKRDRVGDFREGSAMLLIITGLLTVVAIIMSVVGVNEVLTALVNPEYWALREVLSYIK